MYSKSWLQRNGREMEIPVFKSRCHVCFRYYLPKHVRELMKINLFYFAMNGKHEENVFLVSWRAIAMSFSQGILVLQPRWQCTQTTIFISNLSLIFQCFVNFVKSLQLSVNRYWFTFASQHNIHSLSWATMLFEVAGVNIY